MVMAIALHLVSTNAAAQAPAGDLAAQSAARKKAGDQAMEAFRYTDALGAYSDTFAITHDPALLYNMGRALQALNRHPEALEKLKAFRAGASAELRAKVPRLDALIEEEEKRVATVTLKTNAPGARVLVRGTVVGRTPLEGPLKLDAGPAEIELEADGYFGAKRSVDLPGGGELSLEMELSSKATSGLLSVTASAPSAVVFVDDKRIGVAPIELNVSEGSHRVVVKHPDFRTFETAVAVPLGGNKSVDAALQTPPFVARPWFWGTVGGVLLAGAAAGITVAALRERSADTGTIAPGQLGTRALRGAFVSHSFRF